MRLNVFRFLPWTPQKARQDEVTAIGRGGRDKQASPMGVRPATERCSYPGHRGENRRDESPIMKESDIMGVVEAKAHKSAA
jgi:co-chaperonin GroES (HSP10)